MSRIIHKVMAEYDTVGRISPVSFAWPDDDLTYTIDRVVGIKSVMSGKDCDPAVEYICQAACKRFSLFFDPTRLIWWVGR